MKLLVLGGTIFLGRHIVEAALGSGHEVTLFNRGRHNPDLFPQVEKLRGDRAGNVEALKGRQWDAVVDTSGYVPRLVRTAAELLADRVAHYTFISSISVYAEFQPEGIDESAPVQTLPDPSVEEVTGDTYGGLKALCEQAAEAVLPGRVLNVRAGLLVGPYDPINRFPYWLRRVTRGGEVLAPGQPHRTIQLIDVRDLAAWLIRLAEDKVNGTYNVTGAPDTITMQQMLTTIQKVSGSETRFTWADDLFLQGQGVRPFDELPYWVPPEMDGLFKVKVDRALAAGLSCRPLVDTVDDTLAWLKVTEKADKPGEAALLELQSGLSPEREIELLRAWHQRQVQK